MARHHRKRHRGYFGAPVLKNLNPFGKTVHSTDVVVGAFAGLAVGAGVKYLLNKANVALGGKMPAFIMTYAGPISTFLGGVALYVTQTRFLKKSGKLFGSAHAAGHLAGASVAALAPVYWSLLGSYGPKMADGTPFFSDYVMSPYGALTTDTRLGGYTQDSALGFRGNEDYDPMSAP